MRFFVSQTAERPFPLWVSERLVKLGHECAGCSSNSPVFPQFYRNAPGAKLVWSRNLLLRESLGEVFRGFEPAQLSGEELAGFQDAWNDYCGVADRSYLSHRSMSEHRRYFYLLLRYAIAMLRDLRIDFLLFVDVPHFMDEIVFYHAARFLGRRTVIMYQILASVVLRENWREAWAVRPADDFDYAGASPGERRFVDSMIEQIAPERRADVAEPPSGAEEGKDGGHGASEKTTYNAWIEKRMAKALGEWEQGFFARAAGAIRYFLWELYYHATLPEQARFHGGWRRYLPDTAWARFWSFRLVVRNFLSGGRIYRAYRRLAVFPPVDRPYVFLALHKQPEAVTAPLGGVFVDQCLVAETIARGLPKGWILCVKEHPMQFRRRFPELDLGQYTGRTMEDYSRIASLPNTHLVRMEVSSRELIEKAAACATVAGTVGMESMLKGKPVLAFGKAVYSGCDGCAAVSSSEEVEQALKRFAGMPAGEIKAAFLRFLGGLARESVTEFFDGSFLKTRSTTIQKETYRKQVEDIAAGVDSLVFGSDVGRETLQ